MSSNRSITKTCSRTYMDNYLLQLNTNQLQQVVVFIQSLLHVAGDYVIPQSASGVTTTRKDALV